MVHGSETTVKENRAAKIQGIGGRKRSSSAMAGDQTPSLSAGITGCKKYEDRWLEAFPPLQRRGSHSFLPSTTVEA